MATRKVTLAELRRGMLIYETSSHGGLGGADADTGAGWRSLEDGYKRRHSASLEVAFEPGKKKSGWCSPGTATTLTTYKNEWFIVEDAGPQLVPEHPEWGEVSL